MGCKYKVLIASLLSIVATLIVVAVVFFPDACSLQKKIIVPKLSLEIKSGKDMDYFAEYLFDKISDDPEIFELDIMVCAERDPAIQLDDHENRLVFGYMDPSSGWGFDIVVNGSYQWRWLPLADTNRCKSGGYNLTGYYLSLGHGGTHQGYSSTGIEGIPIEQVKLKND